MHEPTCLALFAWHGLNLHHHSYLSSQIVSTRSRHKACVGLNAGQHHQPSRCVSAVVSLQVPSFDNKVAMTMVQQELGRPWQEVYSELTPRPIAAASLGQVSPNPLLLCVAWSCCL